MSKEALTSLLGRAALDHQFLNKLSKDPSAAAREAKVDLTPDEATALKGLDMAGLQTFHTAVAAKKLAALFDKKDG